MRLAVLYITGSEKYKVKCLILAAGYATRLYPLTKDFPKPLLKVGGGKREDGSQVPEKAILDWLIEDIQTCGAADEYIVISNHRFACHFREWAGKHTFPITVVDDGTTTNENRLGAVCDIQFATEQLGIADDCLIIAGDNVLDFSLCEFIKYAQEKGTSCNMRYREDDEAKLRRAGVAEIGDGDRLISLEEKPAQPKSCWCTPPFYYYKAEDMARIREAIADGCGTDAPGSLVAWMCRHSPMHSMVMPGRRYDIGTLESYRKVCETYRGIMD